MAQKCVHQGCGKQFTGSEEVCKYHPGPPIFHEGQKGWTCCKPRVLTFEEFMDIPPCTEGKHSTTDLPPKIEKIAATPEASMSTAGEGGNLGPAIPRAPVVIPARERSSGGAATAVSAAGPVGALVNPTPATPAESEDDDPDLAIPDGRVCRRRGCDVSYNAGAERTDETCVFHPGVPIFHEGSKGYSCCKRRVLEFDEFLRIEGCQTKPRHMFVGSGGRRKKHNATGGSDDGGGDNDEELLDNVRFDFYQSAAFLTASFFLKKIDKTKAFVSFSDHAIDLDLLTTDEPIRKRFRQQVPLYGTVDPAKCKYTILGTKLELVLAKAEVSSWPVLRSSDQPTGEILQVGQAGKMER